MYIKKVILIVFLTLLSSVVFAQNQSEKKAMMITNRMTKALSLGEEEKQKVYEIQIKRFQDITFIRETYKDDPQMKNTEIKKVFKKLYGKLVGLLGKDRMKEWNLYKKNNY